MSHLQAAFNKVCDQAEKSQGVYVSLYEKQPFYGGPEEGGWWGEDCVLVASQQFNFQEDAEAAKEKVLELAKTLDKQARDAYHKQCRDECDWLEARGLDDDFLPQPDGPTKYLVITEERRGSLESQGSRQYS